MRSVAFTSNECDTTLDTRRKMEPFIACPIMRIDHMYPSCQTFGMHHELPTIMGVMLKTNLEAKVVALRQLALGKVEGFRQHRARRLVTQGNDGRFMSPRTE